MSSPTNQKRVDLVLEGGGVKGIALVGGLAVLEEHGYQPQNLAGTSAGAIVATLYAAGYPHQELYTILKQHDFSQFLDGTWLSHIPLAGNFLSIVFQRGIYKGDAFLNWMRQMLEKKGVRTFRDLIHPDFADQPRYRYKVQMIASDLMGRRMLVLPQDAPKLGIANPDDLEVAWAVRMSMSLALYFKPVIWRNPQTRSSAFITDGGMLSDFPVWLFDSGPTPEWPTFGMRLVEDEPRRSPDGWLPARQVSRLSIVDYLKSLLATLMEAHDRYYLENDSFVRTIMLPTLGIQTTDFTLSPEKALALYNAGRKAAEKFLQTWNFERYIAEYRQKEPPSRRDLISETIST
ncbi:MAG TPA: patatin-like phospholipase family protein [Ktedonobacterales bacterium]|jgi:NTE family protein